MEDASPRRAAETVSICRRSIPQYKSLYRSYMTERVCSRSITVYLKDEGTEECIVGHARTTDDRVPKDSESGHKGQSVRGH